MFAVEPVIRLSIAMTLWPSASSRSVRWEPRKPAPPVTSDTGLEDEELDEEDESDTAVMGASADCWSLQGGATGNFRLPAEIHPATQHIQRAVFQYLLTNAEQAMVGADKKPALRRSDRCAASSSVRRASATGAPRGSGWTPATRCGRARRRRARPDP